MNAKKLFNYKLNLNKKEEKNIPPKHAYVVY